MSAVRSPARKNAMTSTLLPNAKQTFTGPNGTPLSGGSVYFYIPGTTTLKDTYQDSAQTILNTNPVVLDANGQAVIWGYGSYRQVVYDANGNLLWDQITEDMTGGLIGDITDDTFLASDGGFVPGTTTQLTLSSLPGSTANMWVFFDGVYQTDDQMSVDGAVLTFSSPIPDGVSEVTVKAGNSISIGTPGTQTVVDSTVALNAGIKSSKLAYNLGAAGSVTRTVQVRLSDWVSVKDFGAVGDGTTDDTTSIQAAITFAQLRPCSVYFPPGTYKTTATLTLDASFSRLFGAGKAISTIASTMPDKDTLLIGSPTSALQSVYVSGMGFIPSVSKTAGVEIDIKGNNINVEIDDCIFTGGFTHYYADSYGSASNYKIANCYFQRSAGQSVIVGGGNGLLQGFYMERSSFGLCSGSITFLNVSGFYLKQIDAILATGDCFSFVPADGEIVVFGFMDQVLADTPGSNGWVIQPTGTGIVANIKCTDCWAAAAGGQAGILINGANVNGFTWTAGHIRNNAKAGFLLLAGTNVCLSDSDVFNNSVEGAALNPGVVIAGNVSDFTITDNQIGGGGYDKLDGSPNQQSYGILINSGSGGNFVVTGNRCDGNVTAGYINLATGSGQKVSDNTNGVSFSTPDIPASGTQIVNPAGRDIRVFIYNGTFSGVGIDDALIGVAGNVFNTILRAGEKIGINYTAAPSWQFIDM